jgi:hypothetical protein
VTVELALTPYYSCSSFYHLSGDGGGGHSLRRSGVCGADVFLNAERKNLTQKRRMRSKRRTLRRTHGLLVASWSLLGCHPPT